MSAKKILMICGDFGEDYEIMVPFQTLQAVGHQVDAVCPDKKAGDRVKTAIHDSEGYQTSSEKPGHYFTLNADFDAVRTADYDALLLPGGRAPEYLRLNARVLEIVREFDAAEKPIASICHGPMILVTAGVLKGRTAMAVRGVVPDLVLAGAALAPLKPGLDNSCIDGHLVTAPAWPNQAAWLRDFLKVLGTKIEL